MRCRVLYPLILSLMVSPAFCLAQAAPPASTSATSNTENAPRAAFIELNKYLRSNPLDFQTTFVAQNISLGTSRGSAHFVIDRPNLLRVEVSAPDFSYLLNSDGQVFTIYDKKSKKYAQEPAPSTPLGAVNLFTGLSAFEAQVLRFLGVIHDVASGSEGIQVSTDGTGSVGGRQCDHFNIVYSIGMLPDKWEAWLEHSEPQLPCKSVITSGDGSLVQTNEYTWNSSPALSPDTFVFTPPSGSQKVDIGELDLQPPH